MVNRKISFLNNITKKSKQTLDLTHVSKDLTIYMTKQRFLMHDDLRSSNLEICVL